MAGVTIAIASLDTTSATEDQGALAPHKSIICFNIGLDIVNSSMMLQYAHEHSQCTVQTRKDC